MSLANINQIMSDNKIDIAFKEYGISERITDIPVSKITANKICQLLQTVGFAVKTQKKGCQLNIIVSRSSITPSETHSPEKDIHALSIMKEKSSPVSFKKAFSWTTTLNNKKTKEMVFAHVPLSTAISYNDEGFPQFDDRWNPFILKVVRSAVENSINAFPAYTDEKGLIKAQVYSEHAQILLNRFLNKNPIFKDSKYFSIHQALMIQAIATAIKYTEDHCVFNSDIAQSLNSKLHRHLIKDLKCMELLFLQGIEGDVSYLT